MGFGNLAWALLGIVAGAAVALQAPVNAALGKALGFPVAAAAVSFFVGAVLLALLTAITVRAGHLAIDWRAPPAWMFVAGGCLGAFFITTTVVLTPRVGAAAVMAFAVTGQLFGGILLDRIGFLGLAQREISLGRIGGALLLLAGALLVRFT